MTSTSKWKRRTLYVIVAGAICGGIILGLYSSAHHVPEFYREALADTNVTVESAEEFQQRTTDLLERMEESPDWSESFTEQQINSWLAYEFPKLDQDWVPPEISEPRVHFLAGTILTAFRYEGEEFSGILSLKIRPRVTENHDVALELISVKAGLLPIPLRRVLEEIPEQHDLDGLTFEIVEIDGRDTVLISHDTDRRSPRELTTIEVDEQQITVSGVNQAEERLQFSRLSNQSETASESSN